MNHWKAIWDSYHLNATLKWLFYDIMKHASLIDKILVFVSLVLVVTSLILVFTSSLFNALWTVAIGEIILFARLPTLKGSLIDSEFGDKNNNFLPHDDKHHQESRYLLFKKSLRSKHITSSHVKDCYELLETQLEIAGSAGSVLKKFASFSGGVLLGFSTAVWRQLDTSELLYVGSALVALCLFVMFVLLLIPSKVEKLREMKYFMQLYCKECE
ncbi:hypothetical protein KP803_21755 [Vibrio sp. ZSDE26]|uniref:Uncharacterized protein n=1 Tax=Vibrio amylolyticus TaxID=2847292 RepID=A0A9X1XNL0_9VIBR|nr:hypothetical protein [Vibrio amylolyticus]MCK6265886.1 hypothetical protein [Vibrio amylolyticus]